AERLRSQAARAGRISSQPSARRPLQEARQPLTDEDGQVTRLDGQDEVLQELPIQFEAGRGVVTYRRGPNENAVRNDTVDRDLELILPLLSLTGRQILSDARPICYIFEPIRRRSNKRSCRDSRRPDVEQVRHRPRDCKAECRITGLGTMQLQQIA